MKRLDAQMHRWAPLLRDDVGVPIEASNALATATDADVRILPREVRDAVVASTPVALRHRLDELRAYEAFMETTRSLEKRPDVTRARVIVQSYICFVYLKDACFEVLAREPQTGCTLRSCCRYLSNDPVRAFRNAFAHGNWQYRQDFKGLIFWDRKRGEPSKGLATYEVSQEELHFWQALARCTAYVVYMALEGG
ncbi:MAG: hypothetical protein FJ291_25505 [Planctomycetes bacterium]|nr:hypothetical protein [Planctomycetota bacterium]